MIKLDREIVREIENILRRGQRVEMVVKNGKVYVWAVESKKRIELPLV